MLNQYNASVVFDHFVHMSELSIGLKLNLVYSLLDVHGISNNLSYDPTAGTEVPETAKFAQGEFFTLHGYLGQIVTGYTPIHCDVTGIGNSLHLRIYCQ